MRKFLNKEADYEDLQVLTGHDGMHFLEVQVHGVIDPTRDAAQIASQYKNEARKARKVLKDHGMDHLEVAAARQDPYLMKFFTEQDPHHNYLAPEDVNRLGRGFLEHITEWAINSNDVRLPFIRFTEGLPESTIKKLTSASVDEMTDAELRSFLNKWYEYVGSGRGPTVNRQFQRSGGTANIMAKADLKGPPDSVIFEVEPPPKLPPIDEEDLSWLYD